MNKQIEEIDELEMVLYEANNKKSVLDYRWLATEAYKTGYRKQIVGEWITEGKFFMVHHCSVCGYSVDYLYQKTPFCPNCGARMRKEGE